MNEFVKWGLIAVGAYLGYEYLIAPALATTTAVATTTSASTPGATTTGVYGGQSTVPVTYTPIPPGTLLGDARNRQRIQPTLSLSGYKRGPSPWLRK